MTLWVNNPATGIPTLHEDMMFTIPTAISYPHYKLPTRILASTHTISYQRGLLVVPPRISNEVKPWEDHPIIQTLLKRITAKWRDHCGNLSPELLLPKAQKVVTTPEHLHGATAWLLNPQTVHIGRLNVSYRPSPVATYAWLSSWQSGLRLTTFMGGSDDGSMSTGSEMYVRSHLRRSHASGRNGSQNWYTLDSPATMMNAPVLPHQRQSRSFSAEGWKSRKRRRDPSSGTT
jgi:hypothetical protein